MPAMWGIHNDKPRFDFVAGRFVALGWRAMPDLREIGDDREAMKFAVAATYPDAKPGTIAAWAGMLHRFAFVVDRGDLVVHPVKADSTVAIGRVSGEYAFESGAPDDRHRRPVEWLRTGVPRTSLSREARYEIGSSLTLFRVRRHEGELVALIDG